MRITNLAMLMALALAAGTTSASGKVVGTCKATVSGEQNATIEGKSYEGKPPEGARSSRAGSRQWQLETAKWWKAKVATMGAQMEAAAPKTTPVITCVSKNGQVAFQAAHGGVKPEDYPDGPHTYRLVNPHKTPNVKSGDLQAGVILTGSGGMTVMAPTEPGVLKLTHSDGDRMAGTFEFVSGGSKVQGEFDFRRPDPGAK